MKNGNCESDDAADDDEKEEHLADAFNFKQWTVDLNEPIEKLAANVTPATPGNYDIEFNLNDPHLGDLGTVTSVFDKRAKRASFLNKMHNVFDKSDATNTASK